MVSHGSTSLPLVTSTVEVILADNCLSFMRDMTSGQTISLICMFFSVCQRMLDTYLQFPSFFLKGHTTQFWCFWDAIFYNFHA